MLLILHQPYPRNNSIGRHLISALISGGIVAVFLRVFSPFGFSTAPVNLNLFAIGYGIITALVIAFFALFEFTFPKIYVEVKWTVGKNILNYLVHIFFIGSANLFYTSLVTGLTINLTTFFYFQAITLSVTFVVVSATTMIKYFRSMKFYKHEAIIADESVHKIIPKDEEFQITIKSENEKENLRMNLNDLLYIEAADNYSKVFYRNNNKIQSAMIRSSLKKIEDQLDQPEFFRCHRTYIVQLRNVEKVSGNSQGYRLNMKYLQQSIPVSRRAGRDVRERLGRLVVNDVG